MLKSLLLPLALVLPALACGGAEEASPTGGETAAPKAQTVALESGERELRCGCKIEGINECGNYVKDGEDWLEISNPDDHKLNKMEWCGVPADQKTMGTVAGERTGNKAALSTLEVASK